MHVTQVPMPPQSLIVPLQDPASKFMHVDGHPIDATVSSPWSAVPHVLSLPPHAFAIAPVVFVSAAAIFSAVFESGQVPDTPFFAKPWAHFCNSFIFTCAKDADALPIPARHFTGSACT